VKTSQNEDTATGTPGSDPAAAAASGSAAVAATPAASATPLVTPPVVGEGGTPAPILEVIPEKYRVLGGDGTLDLEASARKQADAYKQLEAKLGSGDVAPKDPSEYKLELAEGVEAIDFEAFKADPLAQSFLKGAHAKGMTNAQVNYAVNEYLKLAPELAQANAEIRADEARTELAKIWTDDATLNGNLRDVSKAIEGFGGEAGDMPGSKQRLYEKFGSNPDFIAFAAKVAKEMKEDKLPDNGGNSSEADVQALMKSKAYWDATDPQHESTKARVAEFYARQHGTAPR
jgi:hypothetical protein